MAAIIIAKKNKKMFMSKKQDIIQNLQFAYNDVNIKGSEISIVGFDGHSHLATTNDDGFNKENHFLNPPFNASAHTSKSQVGRLTEQPGELNDA